MEVMDKNLRAKVKYSLSSYLQDGKSVSEIAKYLHVTEVDVYDYLTKYLKELHEQMPDIVTEEEIEFVSNKLKNEVIHFDVNLIHKMIGENTWKFIKDAALTFNLTYDSLLEILNVDLKTLREEMFKVGAYSYLFNKPVLENQVTARMKFLNYMNDYYHARVKGEDCTQLNKFISDDDYINFKKTYDGNRMRTDEEILTILRYQVKYGISTEKMGMQSDSYNRRIDQIKEKKNPPKEILELVSNFQALGDFYENEFKKFHHNEFTDRR